MKKFNLKYASAIVSISVALSSFAGLGVSAFSTDGLGVFAAEEVVLPEELASKVSEGKSLSVQLFDGGGCVLKNSSERVENKNSVDAKPGGGDVLSSASSDSAFVTKLDRSVGIEIQEKRQEQERQVEEARRAAEQARQAEEARIAAERARQAEETRKAAERSRQAAQARNATPKAAKAKANPAPANPAPAPVSNSCAGQVAFDAAKSCIGLIYGTVRGGIGLDCSGLVSYAYKQAGINLPHNARAQYGVCKKVSADSLRVGDLVFWASGSNVNHVGIYAGNGNVLESSSHGKPIAIRKIWSSSRQKVIGYGRP